ncbi:SurA N-terminal domain-containing protein [Novosphingobium sp.]|uniref:peptidylprolyl isomerase n=1 Tax=Novosphingobium sp. TaxID=1874826 RepID=UPI003B516C15
MLDFIRTLTRSRIGAVVGLVFLILIVLAFAGTDVSGISGGNLLNGDYVAKVGGTSIAPAELEKTVRASFDSQRQRSPTLSMKAFLAQGAFDEVLTGLIDRAASWEWGRKYGVAISDRLVDSEIAKLAAFQGPDGKFSQEAYNQLLAQRGLTDKLVRDDLAKGQMSRLVFAGANEGAMMPTNVTQVYAALVKEKRTGNLLFIPSAAFAPKTAPTDAQIGTFYKTQIARYNRPERRTIRYAVIDSASLKTVATPSDADIQKRYAANAALYAPAELRSVTQVILPTQAAATAFAAEIKGGKTIEAAAAAKGLSAAKITDATHDKFAIDSSKPVADAVFATAQGQTMVPTKGDLGWVVARIDAVTKKPGKTLDQARAEIATALTAERHKAALTDMATRIGEKVEGGTSLADVAKTYGLTVQTTDPVIADGSQPGKPDAKLPPQLMPLLATAFAMDHEGMPQIAALPGGESFAVYDVGAISGAAPAPLAEIKTQVAADWTRQQGADGAAAAADKVLAALAKITPLDAAGKALGVPLAPVDHLAITREQVASAQGRVPAPVALMFTMTHPGAKKLAAPNQAGWLVLSLASIEPGTIAANDPMVIQASSDLGKATGREYEQQLRTAITHEIGSKRNETAIRTVRGNLVGGPAPAGQ